MFILVHKVYEVSGQRQHEAGGCVLLPFLAFSPDGQLSPSRPAQTDRHVCASFPPHPSRADTCVAWHLWALLPTILGNRHVSNSETERNVKHIPKHLNHASLTFLSV